MKNKKAIQAIASFCLLAFVSLGYMVKFYPKNLLKIDTFIQNRIIAWRNPLADQIVVLFTKTFNPLPAVCLILLLGSVMFWQKRKVEAYWFLTVNFLTGGALIPLLKRLYQRPRPDVVHLVKETGYSFPSGHASLSCTVFLSLMFLLFLWVKNRVLRVIYATFCALFFIAIACSRVYVGVHFPSDVFAGELIGASVVLFSYPKMAEERFKKRFEGRQK